MPGDVFHEKLELAIRQVGAVIVCIGPHGIGRWQTVEYHGVYERLIKLSDAGPNVGFPTTAQLRVIPVLLPGSEQQQTPRILRRHAYVDLRESTGFKQREQMQK